MTIDSKFGVGVTWALTTGGCGVMKLKYAYARLLAAAACLAVLGTQATFGADILAPVTATASANDGNLPASAIDGSLSTRWSADGDGQWLRIDYGTTRKIGGVSIAWYQGNQRSTRFDLQTSVDGNNWATVYNGQSSGTTTVLESVPVIASSGRYLRLVGHGNNVSTWNSVSEVQVTAPPTDGSLVGLRLLVDPAATTLRGSLQGTAVGLNWDHAAGATYQVQASSNMNSWVNVLPVITNTGTVQTWVEANMAGIGANAWPKRFYRVKRNANAAVVAAFTANPLVGNAPLPVQFVSQATGNPVSWSWNFGDGSTSTVQNPSHTYQQPGAYTANLTVRDASGNSSTANLVVQVTTQQTGSLPSTVLNLTNWKLTLPVETSHAGSPDEFLQPELNGFQNPNFFTVNAAHDGVIFTAPCGGATTSGSGYPRSELREMSNGGSSQASWSTTSGTHTMEITQAITHLPVVKPHVVAGQIHNAADDVMVFRLEGTKLFVDQNGVNGPVLTSNYQLGTVFTVKFVARNGGVEVYYNGQFIYTYSISTSGCYFKAGCYTQSNTSKGDSATAYGQVVVYNVTVTHQ